MGEDSKIIALVGDSDFRTPDWCMDNGANDHMCFDLKQFIDIDKSVNIYLFINNNINNEDSVWQLQSQINAFYEWCARNDMELNINKCFLITFTRSHSLIHHQYFINNMPVTRVNEIRDLGIIFDCKLTFYSYIDHVISRSFKMLGFVLRSSKELSVHKIKILCCAIVRSIIEYGSVVWAPSYAYQLFNIEKVQNKFLRFAAFKMGLTVGNYTYDHVLLRLNLQTLEHRRVILDICYFRKIISGVINSEELISLLCFNIPARLTRYPQIFREQLHATKYGQHAPISRLTLYGNKYNHLIDLFGSSVSSMKQELKHLKL